MDADAVPEDEFERLVSAAMEQLPDWVTPMVDEMVVAVEDHPPTTHPGTLLLGTYRGVPHTTYGGRPPGSLPEMITLYRAPILATCASAADVPARILKVLGHEVGHSLGLSDSRLHELGWY